MTYVFDVPKDEFPEVFNSAVNTDYTISKLLYRIGWDLESGTYGGLENDRFWLVYRTDEFGGIGFYRRQLWGTASDAGNGKTIVEMSFRYSYCDFKYFAFLLFIALAIGTIFGGLIRPTRILSLFLSWAAYVLLSFLNGVLFSKKYEKETVQAFEKAFEKHFENSDD